MRILLVDDDRIFTDVLSSSLAARGLKDVTIAHSAQEALDLVEAQRVPFDCFLLDIIMEEMDGVELCRRLRQRHDCRTTPIIMITSADAARHMQRAFAAGATDFMNKPLDLFEMAGRINAAMLLVESARQEKRNRSALRTLISSAADFDLIDLSRPVCFADVDSMVDYYQIENRLLRMQAGLYPLGIFRVQIRDFARLTKRAGRSSLLHQLHAISATISEAVTAQRFMLSYLGHGRFVFCIIDRCNVVPHLLQSRLRQDARQALQDLAMGEDFELTLDVIALAPGRITSRDAALQVLSKEIETVSASQRATLPEIAMIEDRIFSKIDEEEQKLLIDR